MIKAFQFLSNKEESFKDNYLLAGDNDYLYLFIKNQIIYKSQKKDEIFIFDCADKNDSIDQLVNTLSSQDLFSNSKLVIIKNINKLNKKNSEILLSNINLDIPHQILCLDSNILTYDYKTKSKKIKNQISKEISNIFNTIDISTPFESEMNQWINLFASTLNIKISKNYSNKIIEIFGNNFSEIFNEMSKSSLISDDEKYLLELLENSNVHKNKQLWELNYSICDRKVDDIFENGLSIIKQYGLPYLLNSMFIIIEAIFLTKKNNGTILEVLSKNIRENLLNRIVLATRNYTIEELENAIIVFAEIDKKIKTKKIIDETEFTNIINGVFRVER